MWPFRKKSKPDPPQFHVDYPTGSCVQTEKGVFFIKGKFRFRITSSRILNSWQFPFVVEATEVSLQNYAIAGKLGFRQGTLVKDMSNGNIYLISENLRRQVVSPDFFDIALFPRDKIIEVSAEEIKLHKEGEKITWQQPPTSLQAGQ
jgi:hypothetical protein